MRPRLQPIRGTYPLKISIGSLVMVIAPESMSPFPVDAIALEEDTFLVMSADPKVRDPQKSLMRIMTEVIETRPEIPGSVLVRGERPLRFLAIVHDLNEEPSWREEWIESALDKIFQEAEDRRLNSIALPMLGTLHGSLEKERFVALLLRVLKRNSVNHPERLWLVVPAGTDSKIFDILHPNVT